MSAATHAPTDLRRRSWSLAGVGLGLPIASLSLFVLAVMAGWQEVASVTLPVLLVAFIVGAALSLAAMASGLAALLSQNPPRSPLRYLEPWALPVPIALLAVWIVADAVAFLARN